MREIITWAVATVIVGLVLYVVERLIPLDASFQLVVRIMAGVMALIFFVLFIIAVLKYANVY